MRQSYLFLLTSLITFCSTHNAFSYYLIGETIKGTTYYHTKDLYDSLEFISVFDSKNHIVPISISQKVKYFNPIEQPDLTVIQVDYTIDIPSDFKYNDSLFIIGGKTRKQYDVTYNNPFFILKTIPISNLEIIYPKNNTNDIELVPTLRWQEELNPAIRSYELQVSKHSDFSELIVDTLLFNPQFTFINELEPLKVYHWRVKTDFRHNTVGYISASFVTGLKMVWHKCTIAQYHHATDLELINSNRLLISDHQVGFRISDDFGQSWENINLPNNVTSKIMHVDEDTVLAATYDLTDDRFKILKSINNGLSWSTVFTFPYTNSYSIDGKFHYQIKNGKFYVAFLNNIYEFKDLTLSNLQRIYNHDTSFIKSFVFLDEDKIMAVTEPRYLKNDVDFGEILIINIKHNSIKKIADKFEDINFYYRSINILENNFIVVTAFDIAQNNSYFFVSKDTGSTWEKTFEIPDGEVIKTITTFDGKLISILKSKKYSIIQSEDYASNWINLTSNIPKDYYATEVKLFNDSTLFYVGTHNSLYYTNIRNPQKMIVYPLDRLSENPAKIVFSWKQNSRAEKYQIQVAENQEFIKKKSIDEEEYYLDQETTDNSIKLHNFFLHKTYYWRIRPYYENKWMGWSSVYKFEIVSSVSVPQLKSGNMVVYPNPTQNFIKVYKSYSNSGPINQNDNSRIAIYTETGRKILNYTYLQTSEIIEINLSNLDNGVYFLTIDNDWQIIYLLK